MQQFQSILIVGYGNMAGAMVNGWLARGIPAKAITAVDPARDEAPQGVRLLRELPTEEEFDLIVLGVKPQLLDEVASELASLATERTTILSILAGVEIANLANHFPKAKAIVRLMPNLAAALGKSANTLFAKTIDKDLRAQIEDLACRLGATEWVEDEALFHAVTALAGSGPAFVYRFIEALAEGGAELGLDSAASQRLAVQMVEGAAALASASSEAPGLLADRVASPGGTTEAGLAILDDDSTLAALVAACLRAARDRSVELSEK